MQRFSDSVRDALQTRNPSDRWIKPTLVKEECRMNTMDTAYCSFCGNKHKLSELVSGPTVYICEDCVSAARAMEHFQRALKELNRKG